MQNLIANAIETHTIPKDLVDMVFHFYEQRITSISTAAGGQRQLHPRGLPAPQIAGATPDTRSTVGESNGDAGLTLSWQQSSIVGSRCCAPRGPPEQRISAALVALPLRAVTSWHARGSKCHDGVEAHSSVALLTSRTLAGTRRHFTPQRAPPSLLYPSRQTRRRHGARARWRPRG
jgi:hypothetical protein